MTCMARTTTRSSESRRKRFVWTATGRSRQTARVRLLSKSTHITKMAAPAANASPVTCLQSKRRECLVPLCTGTRFASSHLPKRTITRFRIPATRATQIKRRRGPMMPFAIGPSAPLGEQSDTHGFANSNPRWGRAAGERIPSLRVFCFRLGTAPVFQPMPGAAAPFTYLESSFGDSLTDPSLSFIPTVLVSTFYSGMPSEQIEADIVGVCMIAALSCRSAPLR